MDPQTNIAPSSINPETTGATDTFSEQVAAEKTVSEENFNQSQLATSQHNRRIIYYVIWAVLLLLLLSAVVGGSFILWRNRQGLADNLGIGNLFNPTRLDIKGPQATIDVGGGDGLLTVNGSQLITGDLTVNGNTNVGGNLTAASFIGDGSQLTGVSANLPPFVAFTNKNNQLFFGNNQLFRNSSDSTTALTVQQSNGNQVFGIDTTNNKAKANNGLEVGNIANLQGSIFNDPFFGIGGNIYKSLAVATEITNNQPGITYTASGSEFLINPQNDPVANGNLFSASYSGAKIATGNTQNFITVAGSLSSLVHAGSGNVEQAVGQVNVVGNQGPGSIGIAANSSYSTTLSGSGNILSSTGVLALNPSLISSSIDPASTGTINISSGLTAGNCKVFKDFKAFIGQIPSCVGIDPYTPQGAIDAKRIGQQVGLSIFAQDASTCIPPDPACAISGFWGVTAPVNINLYSQGASSKNYIEGVLNVGVCSQLVISALEGCFPNSSAGSGPRLVVNTPTSGYTTIQPDVAVQLYSATATDKVLTVRGATGQTANLTEWQSSAGTALSVVDATGSFSTVGSYKAGTGTAGAPAFSFGTDPDTGIYLAGTNTLGIATSGGTLLTIDANSIDSYGYFNQTNSTDSTQAFEIYDADAGAPVFIVNTTDERVGIGVFAPSNKLDVTDTTDDTPANFTGASGTCTVDTFGGGWSCVSDQKLKENILQINSASDIIDQLRGVTFAWKSDEEKNQVSGFIAQEVQKVLPGLVSTLDDGTLSLNKDGMLPYLVEAVKENNGKILEINSKLADQGIKLDSLSEEFTKLAERVTGVENKIEILETKVINQEQRIKDLESKINTSAPVTTGP